MRVTKALLLWVANTVSGITPPTRFFALRGSLFRAAGASIHPTAKLCGRVVLDNAHVVVGPGTWIGAGSRLIGAEGAPVRVGSNCDLGPEVLLVVGTHAIGPRARRAGDGRVAGIDIGDGSWLGARVTVLAGVSIGPGSVVGAGAVVNRGFTGSALFAGNPARWVRDLPN